MFSVDIEPTETLFSIAPPIRKSLWFHLQFQKMSKGEPKQKVFEQSSEHRVWWQHMWLIIWMTLSLWWHGDGSIMDWGCFLARIKNRDTKPGKSECSHLYRCSSWTPVPGCRDLGLMQLIIYRLDSEPKHTAATAMVASGIVPKVKTKIFLNVYDGTVSHRSFFDLWVQASRQRIEKCNLRNLLKQADLLIKTIKRMGVMKGHSLFKRVSTRRPNSLWFTSPAGGG